MSCLGPLFVDRRVKTSFCTMAIRRFTNAHKLALITQARGRLTQGDSIRGISRDFQIQPQQLRNWLKKERILRVSKKTQKGAYRRRGGCLKEFEEPLMEWFFALRESGVPVNIRAMVLKAGSFDPEFARKSWEARYQALQRLLKANCVAIRVGTRLSQRDPQEMADEAREFVAYMRGELSGPEINQDYVINMDQTPIYFSMPPRRTLHLVGESTIPIASTDNSTSRVSVSVTLTASGLLLKPMMTFKGVPNGRIALREFPTYPNKEECLLTCQKKAWVDEDNLKKWIDGVLKPHLEGRPNGVTPIVLLDSYPVHKMDSIVQAIENLGAKVYHIPGGCTPLAQPVDVGFGAPFKARIRDLWQEYVMELGTDSAIFKTPDRKTVAKWVTEAHTTISSDIVRNAWRKTGLSYFND